MLLACPLFALLLLLASIKVPAGEFRLLRANPAVVQTGNLPQGAMRLQLQAGLDRHDLRLRPKTSLGVLASRVGSKATAYEGEVAGLPGSWVAVTRIGNRWTGLWFDGSSYFGIDSAANLASISTDAAAAAPTAAVVYRLRDAITEGVSFDGDMLHAPRSAEDLLGQVSAELNSPEVLQATLATKKLLVALIADAELTARYGAQTEVNMLALLNVADSIFTSQVGVRLQSGSVTIFQTGSQPFSATTVSNDLLGEVRTYRIGSTQQRASGLSHLLTGRDLDGSTVGVAYLTSLCGQSAAAVSEARGNLAAVIMAHEIGHVFGAPHDGDAAAACAAAPPGLLMAPALNGSQTFSSCSLEQMQPVIANATPPAGSPATFSRCLAPADAADASVDVQQNLTIATGRPEDVPVTVRSAGNISVNAVNLRITLPASLTLVSATGPAAACTTSGSVTNCSLGDIAAGASTVVTVRVQAATAGNYNVALLATASNDGLNTNNSATATLAAMNPTDLAATATASMSTLEVGASAYGTFVLSNLGPADVTDARLVITIPAGLTLVQQTAENMVCASVTAGLTCGPVAVTSGASARVVLTLRADMPGSLSLSGAVSSSRPELATTNDSAVLVLTATSPPPTPVSGGGSGGGGGRMPLELLVGMTVLWLAQTLRQQRRAQARAK